MKKIIHNSITKIITVNIFSALSTCMHIILNKWIHLYIQIYFLHLISKILKNLFLSIVLILYTTFFFLFIKIIDAHCGKT